MSYTILKGQEPGSSGFIVDAKQMEDDGVVAADPKNGVDATQLALSSSSTALTGTLASSGTAVTGTTTAFTTELAVGDLIAVNDLVFEVATITDDTNLTLTVTPTTDFAGDSASLEEGRIYTNKSVEPFNITTYIEESVEIEQIHGYQVFIVDAGV